MSDTSESLCPRFHHAVELIGRRWTGAIVRMLLPGRRRFNELASSIPDISDRMLAERLRELETEGIVVRTVVPETPIRVEYELSEKGRALEAAVVEIERWASTWLHSRDETEKPGVTPAARRKAAS